MRDDLTARRFPLTAVAVLVSIATASGFAAAQRSMDDVRIETRRVAGDVWMLTGSGGNLAAVVGEGGTFLVDDQYAPLTDRIVAALEKIGAGPVRFVVNTHWHGDHTGGNENLGRAGAVIVAHHNVRERMSREQFIEAFDRTVPASPDAALPVVTFDDGVTLHLHGEEIRVFHVERAHTDGDSMIRFVTADVLHAGDVVFSGSYPFIDLSSGGSVRGTIAAVDEALRITGPDTRIVPGHGPLIDRRGLADYRAMLVTVTDRVQALIDEGKGVDEIVEATPTASFDEAWGGGFIDPERFVRIVHDSLTR